MKRVLWHILFEYHVHLIFHNCMLSYEYIQLNTFSLCECQRKYVYAHVYKICTLSFYILLLLLTHWGRVTHICVSGLTIIGSDNGLSPGRRQAIICTNAGILLIGPLGTNFNEILIEILTFSFKKMCLKVSSAKWRLFCVGPNVLSQRCTDR